MTRSNWKIPFVDKSIYKKLGKKDLVIKTWSRNSVIMPEFIGRIFEVYNGRRFIKIKIFENMIGYKLGEFIITKKLCNHKMK